MKVGMKTRKKVQEPEEARELNVESIAWGDLTWVNIEQPTAQEIVDR